MAEIEFGIPGEVQFSYVHVKGTAEELKDINYEMLGALFSYALDSARTGMADARDLIVKNKQKPAQEPASKPVTQEFTENADAAQAVAEGLGATEIADVNEAPYKQPAAPAKPKPWENKKPAAQVAVDLEDW